MNDADAVACSHLSLSVLSRLRPATPLAMDFSMSLSMTFRPNKGLQGGVGEIRPVWAGVSCLSCTHGRLALHLAARDDV
jgi:hypothetical protein